MTYRPKDQDTHVIEIEGTEAQALKNQLAKTEDDVAIVATENVGHPSRFVTAYAWWEIS
jgi:hypothetical protein